MAVLIEPTIHRDTIHTHLAACEPCSDLFAFARERGDRGALAAWRTLLAAHLSNDAERREYDRLVRQLLVEGSWTPERVAAYRSARRELNVA